MKKAASLLCLAVLFLMLGGCQMIRIEEENKTPLAYTVIEDSQIPEEMQELIREKKETEFQIAYQKGTELFLAKGYGRQMSGGYSIQVKELSASSNAVFFETKLIGPTEKIQGGGTVISVYCDKDRIPGWSGAVSVRREDGIVELKKEDIQILRTKSKASSQVTFDVDYNVPDVKPDIGRMIQNKGEMTVEEVRLNEGHAFLKGKLQADLLYVGEEDGRIYSLSANLPMEETLNLDGIVNGDKMCLNGKLRI